MRYLLTLLLALLPLFSFAQYEFLGISNPDRTWNSYPVDVHESVFEIHDKGTFSEVELFISFSTNDSLIFSEDELLEMFSFFELSDDITISDLWLWWGDQLMVAHIIDRWTANRVYESIVDRQQDPAVLYKDSPTSYELRVYPFSRGQVRKLKLSFLIPHKNMSNEVALSLPTKFHELAQDIVEDPVVRYFSEEEPKLSFSNDIDQSFTSGTDSLERKYWQTTLDADLLAPSLRIFIEREETSDIHVTSYTDTTDKYYSLSFTPKKVLEFTASKKVLIMLDYAEFNTSMSKADVIQKIRTNMKNTFDDVDRFNFLYSTVSDQVLSDDWIEATDVKIDSVLNDIDLDRILLVSNLDDILIDGIDFINESGDGELMLISSSDSYNKFQEANSFVESILDYANDDLPKITVLDIQNEDIDQNYRNGVYYYGNDYLNSILVRESGGELINHEDYQNLDARFTSAFGNLEGSITNYTVYPTFSGGFTYANFTSTNTQKLPINSSFVQVGKYFGDLPLNIQFTGTIGDTVFNKQLIINESTQIDSSLKRFWIGRNIDKLEKSNPSNEEVATIIEQSMENRVMSRYTSFLAILPEDSVLIDQSREEDNGGVINSIDETPDVFEIESLKAYPNPFNPNVNIEVKLSEPWDASTSRIVIYNLLGQKVATLNTAQYTGATSFTINWDVSMNNRQLATGVYFVSVQTPAANKKIKITYLK